MFKPILLIDIDGTVSIVGDRLKYLKEKDWDSFYEACDEDKPNQNIVHLLQQVKDNYEFVFCTGRRESVRTKTEKWLKTYKIEGTLLMRKDGDYRHDTIVKPELLEEAGIPLHMISLVLEDRNSMVAKWRELGLTCMQVADGDF